MAAEHSFWLTQLLNKLIGGWVTILLVRLGYPPAHPSSPIPNYVGEEILIILLILLGALVLRPQLSVEDPGRFQLAMEAVVQFCRGMAEDMIGASGERYVAIIGTLGIFIALCNLLGLIPGLDSPTAHGAIPLGCAVVVFLHYNAQGIRHHGVWGYIKQLCGPMKAVAFLMLPIEIFSNLMRMLSLTVRLWANMYAGGLLEKMFTSLVPLIVPAIFMALHIFESFLQAYIFMILPAVYISLATAEEH